jgi:tRNA(Ile2) C34 agmatinyltransferase TiaS
MTNAKCPFCNTEILIIGVGSFSCPKCYERFFVNKVNGKLIITVDDRFDYYKEGIEDDKQNRNL